MNLLADILIWLLLAAGAGFCALGLFGLLIFPDIRSRMYTAIRATLIGVTAVFAAVFVYAASRFVETAGSQYIALFLHAAFLYAIIVAATILLSREIERRVRTP